MVLVQQTVILATLKYMAHAVLAGVHGTKNLGHKIVQVEHYVWTQVVVTVMKTVVPAGLTRDATSVVALTRCTRRGIAAIADLSHSAKPDVCTTRCVRLRAQTANAT